VKQNFLLIAEVGRTHGIHGEVRCVAHCDSPSDLETFETLYLGKDKLPVVIESGRVHKNVVLVKLKGYDTPEEAAKLCGKKLYADRADFDLDDDTYFIADVIGATVKDVDTGETYGLVTDILQNAPTDVYVFKNADNKELCFPAISEVLISVDIDNDVVLIRPLIGLFDV
jgi:16S rRNA processing protein RimM